MLEEFRFATKCSASRQRPVLRRSCSNCSLAKSGKNTLANARFQEFNPTFQAANYAANSTTKLSNLNSLSNGNLQLISNNESLFQPVHLHHSHQYLHHQTPHSHHPPHHQFMHQNSIISNRMHKQTNLKNHNKFSSFNNGNLDSYGRPLNGELYGQPIMPYSLQNLLLLDKAGQSDQASAAQFDGDQCRLPTPPPPPVHSSNCGNFVGLNSGRKATTSNLKPTLIKQRSLAAIDLDRIDQYTDAHFQHHLQTLAHQFNQLQASRQLNAGNLHRTVSNDDNFNKCNLISQTAIMPTDPTSHPELIGHADDLLFTSQEYSPDLDVQYATEDNQTGN